MALVLFPLWCVVITRFFGGGDQRIRRSVVPIVVVSSFVRKHFAKGALTGAIQG